MLHDLVPMLLFICLAATIFAIAYFRNRENMALIDRNINPRAGAGRVQPFSSLKFGLLLVGTSLGLLAAFITDHSLSHAATAANDQNIDMTPLYFSLIAMGGGLGLVVAYYFEKKEWTRIHNRGEDSKQQPLISQTRGVMEEQL